MDRPRDSFSTVTLTLSLLLQRFTLRNACCGSSTPILYAVYLSQTLSTTLLEFLFVSFSTWRWFFHVVCKWLSLFNTSYYWRGTRFLILHLLVVFSFSVFCSEISTLTVKLSFFLLQSHSTHLEHQTSLHTTLFTLKFYTHHKILSLSSNQHLLQQAHISPTSPPHISLKSLLKASLIYIFLSLSIL